ASRELGPEAAERLIQADQVAEGLHPKRERFEDAGVPALRPLIKEPGDRRHRDARPQLAEEAKSEILTERHPPPGPAKRPGVAVREPPEPRGEIGRMQATADARVVRLLVDART